jgi:hypothetical protein
MEGNPQIELKVKLQYKNYEEGEFSNSQFRTAEDTIGLIAAYPWVEQRDHLAIGLTNPSVTIEGPNDDFLKLSPYYNGKWVIHYFDAGSHLYTQSFSQLADTYPLITSFFGNKPFDLAGLKKETSWLQSNAGHFQTGNFLYVLKPTKFLRPASAAIYFIVFGTLTAVSFGHFFPWAGISALVFFLFFVLRIVALGINHYRAAKDKLLIISRGKDEFSFGPSGAPVKFNKKDIREMITYGMKGRGGYSPFTRIEIRLVNGGSLDISCLLIQQTELAAKILDCPKSTVNKAFPFITPSAVTPF